jgi:hypothetical protein
MNKQIAILLNKKAAEVAKYYSNTERSKNYDKEEFEVYSIKPLSEYTARVLYKKTSGKLGMAFFYFVNSGGGYWCYFFPKESHIYGMEKLRIELDYIEKYNFDINEVEK